VLTVVLYSVDPAALGRIPEVYPAHRTFLDEFATGGELMLIGPFGDPVTQGSMAVFRTPEAAERFVAGDPFIREGLAVPEIRDWNALDFT
jgi:uncharacterized protein YciI